MQPRAFLLSWASLFLAAAAAFGVARLVAPHIVSGFGLIACGLVGIALIVFALRLEPPAEACGACGRPYGALSFCGRCGAMRPAVARATS